MTSCDTIDFSAHISAAILVNTLYEQKPELTSYLWKDKVKGHMFDMGTYATRPRGPEKT